MKTSLLFRSLSLLTSCSLMWSYSIHAAVNFDYRHEYREQSRTHYDQLEVGTSLPDNWSFSIATKFKTGGTHTTDEFYKDPVLNAVEMSVGKKFKTGDWQITPLFQPEFNSQRTEWKLGVSPWYTINEQWSIGGLYRFEYTDYAYDSKCNTANHFYCGSIRDKIANRFDAYFKYRGDNYSIKYEYIYKRGNTTMYNNQHYDYEQALIYNYTMGSKKEWSPYLSLGDISVSSKTSQRQLRLRLGFVYAFK
jgi:hypothetical protein